MPTDILIYAIVAAAMVLWLRNVIGTRHGEERERPNPFDDKQQDAENVEAMPPIDMKPERPSDSAIPMAAGITKGETAEAGLVQIALADKTFDVGEFRENASDAFTIIVQAFADGDRETLKELCSTEVYKAFDQALKDRDERGEKVSTEILAIRKADIVAAGVENRKNAFVTIRFTADETYVIEDANGNIIAGHPERVTEMTDKWTFSRDVKSSDPRWLLSKTEDDHIEEEGKTPIPDAG